MALIKCNSCGHMISDRAIKCPKCGIHNNVVAAKSFDKTEKNFNEESKNISNNMKYIILIIIGLIIIVLIGGVWYGFNEYSAFCEKKIAREKFVSDSLAQVRKDSIKLAEQKEKERIKVEKQKEKEQNEANAKERLDYILSKVVGWDVHPTDKYFTVDYIKNFNKKAKEIEKNGGEPHRIWWQYTDCSPIGYRIKDLHITTSECAIADVRIKGGLYDVDFELVLQKVNSIWFIDKITEKDMYSNFDNY